MCRLRIHTVSRSQIGFSSSLWMVHVESFSFWEHKNVMLHLAKQKNKKNFWNVVTSEIA